MYILQESGLLMRNAVLVGDSRHFRGITFLQNFRKPPTMQCHTPQHLNPQHGCCGNLKSSIYILAKINIKKTITLGRNEMTKTAAFSREWTRRAQNKFREQMTVKIHYMIIEVTIKFIFIQGVFKLTPSPPKKKKQSTNQSHRNP